MRSLTFFAQAASLATFVATAPVPSDSTQSLSRREAQWPPPWYDGPRKRDAATTEKRDPQDWWDWGPPGSGSGPTKAKQRRDPQDWDWGPPGTHGGGMKAKERRDAQDEGWDWGPPGTHGGPTKAKERRDAQDEDWDWGPPGTHGGGMKAKERRDAQDEDWDWGPPGTHGGGMKAKERRNPQDWDWGPPGTHEGGMKAKERRDAQEWEDWGAPGTSSGGMKAKARRNPQEWGPPSGPAGPGDPPVPVRMARRAAAGKVERDASLEARAPDAAPELDERQDENYYAPAAPAFRHDRRDAGADAAQPEVRDAAPCTQDDGGDPGAPSYGAPYCPEGPLPRREAEPVVDRASLPTIVEKKPREATEEDRPRHTPPILPRDAKDVKGSPRPTPPILPRDAKEFKDPIHPTIPT